MEIFKNGGKLIVKYLVVLIMSFMVFMSFIAIFSLAGTEIIGYDAWLTNDESGESEKVYTHYFADGEDTKKDDYKDKEGFTIRTTDIRSDFEGGAYIAAFSLAQVTCLILYVLMVPYQLYFIGDRDANRVSTGRMKEDKLKGIKISLIGSAVQILSFVLLVLNKFGVMSDGGLALYRFLNYHTYGYSRLIFGETMKCAEIGWGGIILAVMPIVLAVSAGEIFYILGYKRINLVEKLVYKKSNKR